MILAYLAGCLLLVLLRKLLIRKGDASEFNDLPPNTAALTELHSDLLEWHRGPFYRGGAPRALLA